MKRVRRATGLSSGVRNSGVRNSGVRNSSVRNRPRRTAYLQAIGAISKIQRPPPRPTKVWSIPKQRATLLPQDFRVRGSNFASCQRLDDEVSKLLTVTAYREQLEKQMQALEEAIDKLDRQMQPMDTQAQRLYTALRGHYSRGAFTLPKTAPGNNGWKQPAAYGTVFNQRFENRWKSLVATVVDLMQVVQQRDPIQHQRNELNQQLSKLQLSQEGMDKQMQYLLGKMRECLPHRIHNHLNRGRNPVYMNEENLR